MKTVDKLIIADNDNLILKFTSKETFNKIISKIEFSKNSKEFFLVDKC